MRYFEEQVLRKHPHIRREYPAASLRVRRVASGNPMSEFASGAMLRSWAGAPCDHRYTHLRAARLAEKLG
jgi:hypothetical protein